MTNEANQTPIALVGIGCLFPRAGDLSRYWANICQGVDAITEVPDTHFRPEDYLDADPKAPDRIYVARGGFLDPVDFAPLEFGIAPNTLEATDTTQLLGMLVAKEALADAGYGNARDFDRDRVSTILGVTGTLELVISLGARLGHPRWRRALAEAGVDQATADDVMRRISDSYVGWQEDSFPGLLGNVAAGRIANRLDLGGTNCVVDAACASSLAAIHLAMLELSAGRSDMVLSGGLDTFNDIFMYMCFSKTPALSPTGNSRPFAAAGDGTILGEGLGVVVLKRLADAERDGDRIYAVLKGIGTSSDGKGNAIYAPSPPGQAKALRAAYQLAGVSPETVDLVEAHGTGTKAGDAAELAALIDVYKPHGKKPWCAIGSVKSQIGHTKAAAGVAGLIKASLALHHKVLPPTIKIDQPLPLVEADDCPFYINTRERPWLANPGHPRRAALSSFGFGGSNYHCVLEEHSAAKPAIDWDGDVQIVPFSAGTRAQLLDRLAGFNIADNWNELRYACAQARAAFKVDDAVRLVAVLERDGDARRVLESARSNLERFADKASWSTPERVYFGSGPDDGLLGVLFPGQGAQYPGMLRELACHFPRLLEVLEHAAASFANTERKLGDLIYPHAAFTDEARAKQVADLRATDVAQPALGAVSLGAWRLLEEFGLKADAAAGHSYGELVALCAAGWISDSDLHLLSRERGRLMAEYKEAGGMLAVRAALPVVEQLLRDEGLDLVVANKNAPEQCVLSGKRAEIDRAAEACKSRQLTARVLTVSAAFHSPQVAGVRTPFAQTLASVSFQPTRLPVSANSTGQPYPHDPQGCREILADQLARPVEFVSLIENMYLAGVRTFVEVGPGTVLTGLTRAILGDQPYEALALDASAGKKRGVFDLACLLSALAASGRGIVLPDWDAAFASRPRVTKKPTLTIPVCGANYVKPRPQAEPTPKPAWPTPKAVESKLSEPTPAPARKPAPIVEAREANMVEPNRNPAPTSETARVTQENLAALQRLGAQTAQLHGQFLEGQDRLLNTMQALLEQQQRLVSDHPLAMPAPVPSVPAARPNLTPAMASTPAPQAPPPAAPNPQPIAAAIAPIPTPPVGADDRLAGVLLGIVAEKTGYPTEMLELDMELDSDLGIDSIKRVEIFSALQEKLPAAPAVGSEDLGSLRTLRQVVEFLGEGSPVPAAPAAATPPPPARNGKPAGLPADKVASLLLGIVAEKTGYPTEMLELDMELDSDLGIDSIKRVEIFSALQEQLPEAPAVGSEHLGTLRTLRQVVDFLGAAGPASAVTPATSSVPATSDASLAPVLLEIVADKTGYPTEMLELDMELDSDLGIDSIKRVEIFSALQEKLPQAPAVTSEHLGTLRTLRHVIDFLGNGVTIEEPAAEPAPTIVVSEPIEAAPSTAPAELDRQVLEVVSIDQDRPALTLPVGGVIWITDDGSTLSTTLASRFDALGQHARVVSIAAPPQIGATESMSGLVILSPTRVDDAFLEAALFLAQRAAPALQRAGAGKAFFATVSRLDGCFGLRDDEGDPLSGALSGLAKTAGHEWPEVACKAFDLSAGHDDHDEAALWIADEAQHVGPAEVGLSRSGRCTLRLRSETLVAAGKLPLAAGDVVVATGGARGVTAACLLELARAARPTLVLLGRTPLPEAEPAWLADCRDDAAVKQALLGQAAARLTPRELEEQFRQVLAGREVAANIERLRAVGAHVEYLTVDVRDGNAVRAALERVRAAHGPVRGLVHGAGVLADRLIKDKTPDQFERVFGTKVAGLRGLLDAISADELRFLALFSSTTGRLGRLGQVDYAMANEALNKLAQREARRRTGCRVVAFNWGPWDGGMVSPALRNVFASEGVGLIPLEAGGQLLRELQAANDPSVEVVVLARLGRQAAESVPSLPAVETAPRSFAPVTRLELHVDVERMPILKAHVLDGQAVVPLALMMEWLGHGALHGNPGLVFHGFDDLRVLKGIRLEAGAQRLARVLAGKARKEIGFWSLPVELRSTDAAGREFTHASANAILVDRLPEALPLASLLDLPARPGDLNDVYQILFHGPELQGIERIEASGPAGMKLRAATAATPADWLRQPWRSSWLADPLAVDVALQAIILWGHEQRQVLSLPCGVGGYRQYRRAFPRGGVDVLISSKHAEGSRIVADVDFVDETGVLVARLTDCEYVADSSLAKAFRRNRIETLVSQ